MDGLVILFVLLIGMFFGWIGRTSGYEEAKEEYREGAVKAGYAEWEMTETGETEFRWKECECE